MVILLGQRNKIKAYKTWSPVSLRRDNFATIKKIMYIKGLLSDFVIFKIYVNILAVALQLFLLFYGRVDINKNGLTL
jgi:hypothetical protein